MLTPDEMGVKKAEVFYLETDDGDKTAIMVQADLLERLKTVANERGTSPSRILTQSVLNAFENPTILSDIELRHVRGRRA